MRDSVKLLDEVEGDLLISDFAQWPAVMMHALIVPLAFGVNFKVIGNFRIIFGLLQLKFLIVSDLESVLYCRSKYSSVRKNTVSRHICMYVCFK